MNPARIAALDRLRAILKPGDTIYTVLRHVSRSGMSRTVDVYAFMVEDGSVVKHWISYSVAQVIGSRFDDKMGGIRFNGCGYDAGTEIAQALSFALYPNAEPFRREWI